MLVGLSVLKIQLFQNVYQCLLCLHLCMCTNDCWCPTRSVDNLGSLELEQKMVAFHNMGVAILTWILCHSNRYPEPSASFVQPDFVQWATETKLGQHSISFEYYSYCSMWFLESWGIKVKTHVPIHCSLIQTTFSQRCTISHWFPSFFL